MKRGIFIILTVLFMLFSASYVFGHGFGFDHCDHDTDCDAGEICENDHCETIFCQSDSACGDTGRFCLGGFCTSIVCDRDDYCLNRAICRGGICTSITEGHNGPCGSGYTCTSDQARCRMNAGYSYEKICADNKYCNPTINSCDSAFADGTTNCNRDIQCLSNICYEGECVSSSSSWSTTCGPGFECSDDRRKCVAGTRASKWCAEGYYCGELNGQPACVEAREYGESCNEDYECSTRICNSLERGAFTKRINFFEKITGSVAIVDYLTSSAEYASLPPGYLADLRAFTGKICVDRENWIGICPSGDYDYVCTDEHDGCIFQTAPGEPFVRYDCANNYYCNNDVCVAQKQDGSSCEIDAECRSEDCYEGTCRSSNYWLGPCPFGLSCSDDGIYCGSGTVASKGGFAKISYRCANGLYCDNNSNSCVPQEGAGQPCEADAECETNNCVNNICTGCNSGSDCPSEYSCNTNSECQPLPCFGETCSEGQVCNDQNNLCQPASCTTDPECPGGFLCIESVCTSEPEVTEILCTTSSDCSILGANYSCYTNGGSHVCRPAGTEDIDEDGMPDNIDPCVGSNLDDCTLPGGGRSCSSAGGRTCNTNCVTVSGAPATHSPIASEANCWVPNTCTCEGAPLYFASLGTSVRFNRECLPGNNCLSRVRVVYSNDSDVSPTLFSSMSLTQTSNPYTENDPSCCGIELEPQDGEQRAVPGYGAIALLLSGLILILYYTKRKFF